jgi:hypothetical protein
MTAWPALLPGDVIAVRTPGWAAWAIRLGAALRGQPNLDNHIAVLHHFDAGGIPWFLEGRPGGVGWRDGRSYMDSKLAVANISQPKTQLQRAAVCKTMLAMIGTPYDWAAILDDGAMAFGLPDIWKSDASGVVPGAVVCSSLAAYAYDKNGLKAPDPADYAHVTPGQWTAFILAQGWA